MQVPNNRREDVATELHYQHANEGLQDPIPIEIIMSLLEEYDDDAVATLRHMRSLESEEDEDDAVGSDFTDESSDEESFCDRSDRKKPRKKKSLLEGKKSMQKRRKCIVFGCTKTAMKCILKCACHQYPCSISGCKKFGEIVFNNVRFCQRHAKTEVPAVYAQYRHRINLWKAERYRTDVKFRIAMIVRSRLIRALKRQGTSHQGKNKLLNCTVDQFKRYLEQFFSERGNRWMNWDNQGRIEGVRCWEMDHIYPLSKLDLTNPEILRRAQHWSNFQPLSAADNNEKKARIPVGFEWRDDLDRWWWSDDSGRINYELPAASAEDATVDDLLEGFDDLDEFDESEDYE